MGANSKIEWCDHTFNPWIGCTRVSPGCDNCYAAVSTPARTLGVTWGAGQERRRTAASTWRQPLAWDRQAQREGRRARVFCASLADVFDNQVDGAWRCELWDLIFETPHLDWLLLTKRPQNIAKMLPRKADGALADWSEGWPNVWLGTTAENQAEADRRIPHLLAVPAAKRFLSCEPLLGPVDLRHIRAHDLEGGLVTCDALHGTHYYAGCGSVSSQTFAGRPRIDWVISGGESGPDARPSHPDWHRSLRDQCAAAGVPFFFKQWGEWAPDAGEYIEPLTMHPSLHCWGGHGREAYMHRAGKKAAGALLDGREHRAVPA